jgi:DUF971 family protein
VDDGRLLRVQELNAARDAHANVQPRRPRQRSEAIAAAAAAAAAAQQAGQRAARRHFDDEHGRGEHEAVDGADVGVAQRLQQAQLAQQRRRRAAAGGERRRQQGDGAAARRRRQLSAAGSAWQP